MLIRYYRGIILKCRLKCLLKEAIITNTPIKIGGNVLNTGLIDNLPYF